MMKNKLSHCYLPPSRAFFLLLQRYVTALACCQNVTGCTHHYCILCFYVHIVSTTTSFASCANNKESEGRSKSSSRARREYLHGATAQNLLLFRHSFPIYSICDNFQTCSPYKLEKTIFRSSILGMWKVVLTLLLITNKIQQQSHFI